MAHLFVDDDYPEVDEYISIYIYFDENDPESLKNVLKIARMRTSKNITFTTKLLHEIESTYI